VNSESVSVELGSALGPLETRITVITISLKDGLLFWPDLDDPNLSLVRENREFKWSPKNGFDRAIGKEFPTLKGRLIRFSGSMDLPKSVGSTPGRLAFDKEKNRWTFTPLGQSDPPPSNGILSIHECPPTERLNYLLHPPTSPLLHPHRWPRQ
jgi:hypothetical protein